jgi:hypothetical protein
MSPKRTQNVVSRLGEGDPLRLFDLSRRGGTIFTPLLTPSRSACHPRAGAFVCPWGRAKNSGCPSRPPLPHPTAFLTSVRTTPIVSRYGLGCVACQWCPPVGRQTRQWTVNRPLQASLGAAGLVVRRAVGEFVGGETVRILSEYRRSEARHAPRCLFSGFSAAREQTILPNIPVSPPNQTAVKLPFVSHQEPPRSPFSANVDRLAV